MSAIKAVTKTARKAKKRKLEDAITVLTKSRKQTDLYVAKLPLSFDEQDVRDMCAPFGIVSKLHLLRERPHGTSRGAALVQMESHEQCLQAIETLNNVVLPVPDSRGPIVVEFSRDKQSDSVKETSNSTKLYFSGLPTNIDNNGLKAMLSRFGNVVSTHVLRDVFGVSRGTGLATMSSHDECEKIIDNCNDTMLPNGTRKLAVRYAEKKNADKSSVDDEKPVKGAPTNLFISGLPVNFTSTNLEALLAPFGSAKYMRIFKYPDHCNGLAEMSSRDECEKVIANYNNTTLPNGTRKLVVKHADNEKGAKRMTNDVKNPKQQTKKSTQLYVAGLAPDMSEDGLKALFSSCGRVTAVKILRDNKGVSRRVGFVHMATQDDCEKVIAKYNLTTLPNCVRVLNVRYADNEQDDEKSEPRLYITGLPPDMDEDGLKAMFSSCGSVTLAKILRDPKGVSRRVGFVHMATQDECENAIAKYNFTSLPNCVTELIVKFADPGKRKVDDEMPDESTTLYVSILPPCLQDVDLYEMFSSCGYVVSARVLTDVKTGHNAGLVHMLTEADCQLGIATFNGVTLPDCVGHLIVRKASKKELAMPNELPPVDGSETRFTNLYISGLDSNTGKDSLVALFSRFGQVKSTRILFDKNGHSRCVGFVHLQTVSECDRAIAAYHGKKLPGSDKTLVVKYADNSEAAMNQDVRGPMIPSLMNAPMMPPNIAAPRRNVLIEPILAACKQPLIGLQYVTEFQNEASQTFRDTCYACELCSFKASGSTVLVTHITSLRHRSNYLLRHHPPMVQELRARNPSVEQLCDLLTQFAQRVETMDGSGMLKIRYETGVSTKQQADNACPASTMYTKARHAVLFDLLGNSESLNSPELNAFLDRNIGSHDGAPPPVMQGHAMAGGQGHAMAGGQGPAMAGGQGQPTFGPPPANNWGPGGAGGGGGNVGYNQPAMNSFQMGGSGLGSGNDSVLPAGILDVVNNDEEAEAALQVSSQLAQALIKYRLKKKAESQVASTGPSWQSGANNWASTAPTGGAATNWTGTTPGGAATNWPGAAPSGGAATNWVGTASGGGGGAATNWPGSAPGGGGGGGAATSWPGTAPSGGGGGAATNWTGLGGGGGAATNWPGTAPGGGAATNWPGTASGGGAATNWPGTAPGGGAATNWPGTAPGGAATNWPGTAPGSGAATNWPGTAPGGGGAATNWPGTAPSGGGAATNWPGIASAAAGGTNNWTGTTGGAATNYNNNQMVRSPQNTALRSWQSKNVTVYDYQ